MLTVMGTERFGEQESVILPQLNNWPDGAQGELLVLRQVRVHDFDGHDGTAAGIAGLIHGGHAAHADFVQDLVVS